MKRFSLKLVALSMLCLLCLTACNISVSGPDGEKWNVGIEPSPSSSSPTDTTPTPTPTLADPTPTPADPTPTPADPTPTPADPTPTPANPTPDPTIQKSDILVQTFKRGQDGFHVASYPNSKMYTVTVSGSIYNKSSTITAKNVIVQIKCYNENNFAYSVTTGDTSVSTKKALQPGTSESFSVVIYVPKDEGYPDHVEATVVSVS